MTLVSLVSGPGSCEYQLRWVDCCGAWSAGIESGSFCCGRNWARWAVCGDDVGSRKMALRADVVGVVVEAVEAPFQTLGDVVEQVEAGVEVEVKSN